MSMYVVLPFCIFAMVTASLETGGSFYDTPPAALSLNFKRVKNDYVQNGTYTFKRLFKAFFPWLMFLI